MPLEDVLLSYPNVIGYGKGYKRIRGKLIKEPALIVLVSEKLPGIMLGPTDTIPEVFIEQVTDVLPVGTVRALRTGRHRPAPGGVSIGHHAITAGTLGVVVKDLDGTRLILSNNHVLANSNDASPGNAIYQPGPVDGGTANDTIATLERFIPIDFGGGGCLPLSSFFPPKQQTNLVDAALARPLTDVDVSDTILEIGLVSGILPATLGQAVRKSGRTTALTHSSIQVVDATVQVQYGAGKIAMFEDQLIAGPMSQGGDSGSLVVDEEEDAAVGLLFAGSNQVTIFNKISNVTQLLGITI